MEKSTFHCWACETRLYTMHEIAQGVCDTCKADILRKKLNRGVNEELMQFIRVSSQNPLPIKEKNRFSNEEKT